MAGDNIFLA